jgi:hypothetical protein
LKGISDCPDLNLAEKAPFTLGNLSRERAKRVPGLSGGHGTREHQAGTWQTLAKMRELWPGLAKIGEDWRILARIGENWRRLSRIGEHSPGWANIGEDQRGLANIGED